MPEHDQPQNSTCDIVGAPAPALSLGRSMVVAVFVASLLLFVGVASLMWTIEGDAVNAVGLGLFCAFWGGPGFGAIAGGAAHTLSVERLQSR